MLQKKMLSWCLGSCFLLARHVHLNNKINHP